LKLKDKKILIISPESWGINYVSKHHYASELSNKNSVFFLNPPSNSFSVKQINNNLNVIDYKEFIRGTNRIPAFIRHKLNILTIRELQSVCKIKSFDVIWSFDPFRFQNLFLFDSPIRIYHPVDVHQTKREREIAESASVIFTTSDIIKKRLRVFNSRIFNIGHGLSKEFISKSNIDVSRNGPIKVCMMGNLQRKIDYPLLFFLIEQNPDIEFHFIGPYSSSNLSKKMEFSNEIYRLKSFDNCFLHGSIHQPKLPVLLNKMDVFLILYRDDENQATKANPHKLLEYLSTGKVVLSNYIEEYGNKEELLVMTKDRKEIPELFTKIISNQQDYNNTENADIRSKYAFSNSYESKISMIESLL